MNADGPSRTALVRVGQAVYGGSSQATVQREHPNDPFHLEVPFAIAGERLRVGYSDGLKRAASGVAVQEVIEPSPDRTVARCRHFGVCGGCHYQHMADKAQLQTKAEVLERLLQRAGVAIPPARLHAQAGEPWAYRNRVRFRVEAGRVGYSRRASHAFLPVGECPILSPLLWRAAEALTETTSSGAAGWPGGTSEVELFATAEESTLQMSVHVAANVATLDREAPHAFRALCAALKERVPQLAGGGLLVQGAAAPGAPRRVQERQRVEVARWGEPGMIYRVGGREYPVSRNAFFQVNRFLSNRLVDLVVGGRTGELALDLFAGAGLFSLPLTERFRRVVSVEVGEPAATDLRRLLQRQGPQHAAVQETTLAFLRRWQHKSKGPVPGLVVVDPPRAGIGEEALRLLLNLGAPEIAYVSCDPVSFAREARALVDSRYAVAELHLLDLFPQTFHMETVAVFRRT